MIIFILLFQPSLSSPSEVLPKASGGSSVVDPARRMNDEGPKQRGINDPDGEVVLPSEDMYCGMDWLDASRECHKPCPTGYDAECSKPGWTCQWYTGCAAKLASKSESEVSLASEHLLPAVRTESNETVVSCPDCQNGAECVYQEDGKDPYCDCSTATAGPNEDDILFAGKYCEHEATDYCVTLGENGSRLFCTNFGKCPFEIKKQSCDCRGGYYGVHCEYLALVESPPSLEEIPPSEEARPSKYDDSRPCSAFNECMYNSTCVYELSTGDPYCDCSSATKGPNAEETLYAGKYCEFEATSYCMVFDINGKQLFCTNFGKCPQEGTSRSCDCPDGYYGMHCEHPFLPESDDGMEVDSELNDDDAVFDGVLVVPETNSTETTEEKIKRNSTLGVPWQKCPSEVAVPSESIVCVGRIVERPDQPNISFCDCRTESPIFLGECCAYQNVTSCPPGYFNLAGRQTSADNPCLPCESAYLYGTTVCETTRPTFRPTTSKPVTNHGLERFFESTRGEDWTRNDNWLSDTSVCSWFGVKCNNQSENIELILPSNQLNGYLDQNAFSNFQHMTKIDLSGNFLYGDLNSFPNIMELQSLNLSKNQFKGTIPNILGRFPALEELILNGNDLSWFNPFGYENLRILDLSDNVIAGTVQYDLPKLWNLERVSLSGNMLEGGFPDSYSSLRNLTEFQIGWNSISGDIINSPWRENANLRILNISHNFLRGTIPKDLMESSFDSISLHNTTISIDLSFNSFESTLPDFDIESLDIEVVGNILSDIDSRACERDWNGGDAKRFGCDGIACTIGSSNELGRQTGSNQCLPCPQAMYIGTVGCNDENKKPTMPPIGLSQRTTLEMFYRRTNGNSWGNNFNWLSELMYCEWFGVECDDTNYVSSLKLPSNSLERQIDFEDLSGLPRLELLDLSENRLTGIITNGIVDLGERSIKSINLSNNFLSGTIPDFPTAKLEVLDLSKNALSGRIPNFDLPNLSVLDLSHNNLSGTIPILEENRLMRYLNFSNNILIGEIPPEVIPISDYPVFLDLSFNNLSGVVPYVRTLDLFLYVAGNLLEGIDGDYCDVEADCDTIACAVGFWNPEGRESDESLCQPCPSAIYIGSVECATANTAPSAAPVEEAACSSDHKCRNGAKCIPIKDGGYYCDCKSIPATWFEIYAGEFCEYQATEFCSDLYHVASYSFCVNGGQCLAVDIMPGATHQGCSCPQGFVGQHCEFLLSIRPSNSPSDFISLAPTSNSTSSPILLSKTFDLHELPSFSVVLLSSNESELSISSLGVLELILEGFLFDELAPFFHTPDSFYITALRLSADEPYLYASGFSNISEQSKGLIFTKVSGIVSLREGIVPDADEFLKTSMAVAFQSTRSLAERIQKSGNSELQSVLKVELTNRLEICPNDLRCLHGSQCIEFDDGGFGCDCSLASGNSSAIIYDGRQCEFIATEFCSDDIIVKQYSYCANSGDCGRKNITVNEPHPGCWCPELFEGSHCQFAKDESLPRSINASNKNTLAEKPSSDSVLGTGAYVIFSIMGVGLIITIVILLYKSKQRHSTLVKNPSDRGIMDREETSILALEAGVAMNPSRTGPPTTTVEEEKEEIAAIPTNHYEVSWSNDQKTISTTQNEESERPARSIKQTNKEGVNTLADATGAHATANPSATKHLERGPVEVPLHQENQAGKAEFALPVSFITGDVSEGNAGLASEPSLENHEEKSSSPGNPLSDSLGKSDRTLDEEMENSAMKNISFHGNSHCSSEAIPTSQEGSTGVDDGHEDELVTANDNIDVAIDSEVVNPCKSSGPGDSELNEKKSDQKKL